MALSFITPTKRLRPDAAGSYKRMRAAGMPAGITSAHRSSAAQQKLRDAYLNGHGNYALPPADSNHVKGTAIDVPVPVANWLRNNGVKYGWTPVTNERWHFDYNPDRDQVAIDARIAAARAKAAAAAKARAQAAAKTRAQAVKDLKAVQTILKRYGYTGAIDGDDGPKTQTAWDKLTAATK